MEENNTRQEISFYIPAFNENAKVSLLLPEPLSLTQETIIQIKNVNINDYGMICAKLYESQCAYIRPIRNNQNLRDIVKSHFSMQRPHTGYDAMLSKTDKVLSTLLSDGSSLSDMNDVTKLLETLKDRGYVTIDTNLRTSKESNRKLSTFLQNKTIQDSSIRSDTVAFLDKNDVSKCGLEDQFELLMGMASFLNENMSFDDTGYDPLLPGLKDLPLSNPRNIQAAEYSHGEFYVAHR